MNQAILDPSPEEWVTQERILQLKEQLGNALPLLIKSGVLVDVIISWIKIELGETQSDSSASMAWANKQWGHRVDSLFLQKKDQLDQASCRLLRVREQGLSLELYHRLLENEESFDSLSMRFGVGKERFNGGLIKQQPLTKFPENMGQLLRKLQLGELSKPMRMGKLYGVIRLESFVPATHGDDSAEVLLKHELKQWITGMAKYLAVLVS